MDVPAISCPFEAKDCKYKASGCNDCANDRRDKCNAFSAHFFCNIEKVIVVFWSLLILFVFAVEILLSLKVLNIWIWLSYVVYIVINCFQLLEQEIQGGSKMMKINLGKECTFRFR